MTILADPFSTDVRAAVVRVGPRKIGEAFSAQLVVIAERKAVVGHSGRNADPTEWLMGAVQSTLTMKTFMPVSGMKKQLLAIVVDQGRVDIEFDMGRDVYHLARAIAAQFTVDSEVENGTLEGTFVFKAGKPIRIQ